MKKRNILLVGLGVIVVYLLFTKKNQAQTNTSDEGEDNKLPIKPIQTPINTTSNTSSSVLNRDETIERRDKFIREKLKNQNLGLPLPEDAMKYKFERYQRPIDTSSMNPRLPTGIN